MDKDFYNNMLKGLIDSLTSVPDPSFINTMQSSPSPGLPRPNELSWSHEPNYQQRNFNAPRVPFQEIAAQYVVVDHEPSQQDNFSMNVETEDLYVYVLFVESQGYIDEVIDKSITPIVGVYSSMEKANEMKEILSSYSLTSFGIEKKTLN